MTTPRKSEIDSVKSTLSLQSSLNEMTVDKINDQAPDGEAPEPKVSYREIAAREGIRYIEPKRRLKGFGELPEKLKKEHAHAWEYVKGMFENYIINTEPLTFWLSLYPGDPDCLWEIPPNVPVYIPRHVAKHLEETMKYHTFSFIEKPKEKWKPGDSMEDFAATGTFYRGKFRAIGAFS
jgi:hypothetical protein